MDNLLGEMFYGWRSPGWHGKGITTTTPCTAMEALNLIQGEYEVETRPLYMPDHINPGKFVPVDDYIAVVRKPMPIDPHIRVFGIEKEGFKTFDGPRELCLAWDKHVDTPVETIGVIGQGETFFLTSQMDGLSIKGDDLNTYLFCDADFSKGKAVSIRVTCIRVVCQNTVFLARSQSLETYHINHTSGNIRKQLDDILRNVTDRAKNSRELMKDVFDLLASRPMNATAMVRFATEVYPLPPEPELPLEITPEERDKRMGMFELRQGKVFDMRKAVNDIFNGKGFGSDTTAFAGTQWGAYNSVVELADWGGKERKTTGIPGLTDSTVGVKERALKILIPNN